LSALSQNTARNTTRMAQVMVEKTTNTGACTENDLISAGFSWSQIVVLGVDARRQAAETLRPRNLDAVA